MSDTPVEETELLIFDQGDSILPQSTESSAPLNGNDNHTRVQYTAERPPDDNGPVENNEIALPGTGSPFLGIKMPLIPLQPARPIKSSPADEIDNENKRWLGLDGEEEPQHSIENPIDLEDVIQPCPDDSRPVNCCCLNSTSYLEKKQKDLFFAVNYHEEEKVKKILAEEEFHTLVKLLTKRDANGLPCVMRAIMRLSCIQILLDCINGFPDHEDKMMALQSIDGRNVFHFAAQEVRNHELIKSIETSCPLKKELVDDPDDCGTTPLMLACHFNNHAMVRTLVRLGAKIDHVNKDGYSPIYRVTASGSAEILQLFLVEGSRKATNQSQLFTNSELYKGGTILQAILESSSSEKSEKLRTCMNVQDGREHIIQCLKIELKRNKSFIHKLCETPLVELVELAIEENDEKDMVFRKTDERGNTPLIRAIEAKQFGVVRLILSTPCGIRTLTEKKVDTKETALMIACKKGFEIVEFMLETSTDTDLLVEQDRVGRNAFHHAAKNDTIFSLMIDVCKRTERYNAYKNYLNQKDTNGFTPLHYAATAGSYKIVKLLLENGVPYDIRSSSGSNKTALHYAACSNISTVETLVEFVKKNESKDALQDYLDAVDFRLQQTALHIAASLQKWQTVSFLLENGATIKYDKENETALHLASYVGCNKCVESLLAKDEAIVNSENLVGETPAMFAALNNQKETLELLLSRNAQLFAPSHADSIEKKKTCLDWAVENRRPDIVRVILTYDQGRKWEEAMKKSWVGPDGLLAKMVVTMPEVAIEFLNECVKTRADGTSEYDFFALQTKKASEDKPGVKSGDQERVTSLQAIEMMAKYSRVECLNHVVVQKFLDHKWSVSARNWYFSCFGVYIIFLLSLTTYITLIIEGRTISSDKACAIIAYICWVFVILSIIKEGFQLFHQKWQYFCVVSTYLELIMYVCVLIFLPYDKKSDLQRLASAIAIFLGWINFAWFLKLFPNYGIYIIMAKKIFITFFRVCVPLSFFIIAFSMTFFVLFNKKDDGFDHIVKSFLTSFAMMVGEVDYRDAFLVYEGKYITKVFILVFLALFLILMSILLMNLLTGLAVGDIGVIMRRSLVEKQIQKALLIVDMDKHLNKYPYLGFGAKYVKPLQEGKKPNTASCVQNLKNVIFPRLDIQEEKEACENNEILRQLDNMQNTLHELKKSLRKTQTNSLTRNGEYFRPRRNTTI